MPNRFSLEKLEDRRLLTAAVSVIASGGGVATSPPPITVPPGPVVPPQPILSSGVTIHAKVNQPFTAVVGSFSGITLPPPSSIMVTQANILWGDGTASQGTLVAKTSGGYDVVGAHTYKKTGNIKITVIVTQGPVSKPGQPAPMFPTRLIAIIKSLAIVV
jgi:hypothetical protein